MSCVLAQFLGRREFASSPTPEFQRPRTRCITTLEAMILEASTQFVNEFTQKQGICIGDNYSDGVYSTCTPPTAPHLLPRYDARPHSGRIRFVGDIDCKTPTNQKKGRLRRRRPCSLAVGSLAGFGAASELVRWDQTAIHHLEQLRDAQLVHAGLTLMSLCS